MSVRASLLKLHRDADLVIFFIVCCTVVCQNIATLFCFWCINLCLNTPPPLILVTVTLSFFYLQYLENLRAIAAVIGSFTSDDFMNLRCSWRNDAVENWRRQKHRAFGRATVSCAHSCSRPGSYPDSRRNGGDSGGLSTTLQRSHFHSHQMYAQRRD